jgi:ankyrin repeat protein
MSEAGEVNTSGKAIFVRDEHGDLHVVKPGERLPVLPPAPAVAASVAANAGEQDGFFSEAPERAAAAARERAERRSSAFDPTARSCAALLAAARAGDDDAVRAACSVDESAVSQRDHLGRTALHMAAYAGHPNTVELLLAFDAKHSALASDSTTPLHFAAQNGHASVCKLLLKAGAKVNARGTKRNDTPLHLCAFRGHVECLQYLLKKNADVHLKNRVRAKPARAGAQGLCLAAHPPARTSSMGLTPPRAHIPCLARRSVHQWTLPAARP